MVNWVDVLIGLGFLLGFLGFLGAMMDAWARVCRR